MHAAARREGSNRGVEADNARVRLRQRKHRLGLSAPQPRLAGLAVLLGGRVGGRKLGEPAHDGGEGIADGALRALERLLCVALGRQRDPGADKVANVALLVQVDRVERVAAKARKLAHERSLAATQWALEQHGAARLRRREHRLQQLHRGRRVHQRHRESPLGPAGRKHDADAHEALQLRDGVAAGERVKPRRRAALALAAHNRGCLRRRSGRCC